MRFDPKSEAEVSSGGLLPAGQYDFEVTAAVEKISQAGNDMIELTVNVLDNEGAGHTIYDYLVGTDKSAFKVRHFADSTGMLKAYERGELRAEDCVGRTGECKVALRKDKTLQYPDKNSISDYVKSDTAKAPAELPMAAKKKTTAEELSDDIPF